MSEAVLEIGDELEETSREIARTPSSQGSDIPKGWKPTETKPVPVIRCVQIKADGERCDRWSLRGYTKCYKHSGSGNFSNVKEYADAIVEAARLRLVRNTDEAINVIEQLMQPGTSENVRLKAATEVLDRAGVRGGVDIHTEHEVTVNPSELLTDRLAQLKRRSAEARERMADVFGSDVIDAEIVDENAETGAAVDQPSLFDVPGEQEPGVQHHGEREHPSGLDVAVPDVDDG